MQQKIKPIKYDVRTKNVLDLTNYYNRGQLNLEPAFQRKSVWKDADRKKLIDSILRGYPIPAIVLYRGQDESGLVYEVIDGKQRLEAILKFTGELKGPLRGMYSVKTQLPSSTEEDAPLEEISWSDLKRRKLQDLINHYEIAVIEVDGDLGEIFQLFVRINSTGMPLTRQEQAHAKFSKSPFLKEATRLAEHYQKYFVENGIVTAGQVARMKHVELISELMLSIHTQQVINKKAALDRVMGPNPLSRTELTRASSATMSVINRLKRMFPDLKHTRFVHLTDFYTLAVLIAKFEREKLALADPRACRLAADLLTAFSTEVDHIRELRRKGKAAGPDKGLYTEYMLTVLEATDSISQRQKRQNILEAVLRSLFEQKALHRTFSVEQRRILWNTTQSRRCTAHGCKKDLDWDDFTIDHIKPYAKGGATSLANAALMCRAHNSSKGMRSKPRKVRS